MSRYRPPPAPRSRYITAEGEQQLKAELHQLWKVERRVTQSVAEAAALRRSVGKCRIHLWKKTPQGIDSSPLSQQATRRIFSSQHLPDDLNKVYFGAWVTLEDDRGELVRYRLVGRMKPILNAATSASIPHWGKPFWASPPRVTSQSQRPPEKLATSSRAFRTRISQYEACLSACYSARAGSALSSLEMLTAASDIASVYKQQDKFAPSTSSLLSNWNAG